MRSEPRLRLVTDSTAPTSASAPTLTRTPQPTTRTLWRRLWWAFATTVNLAIEGAEIALRALLGYRTQHHFVFTRDEMLEALANPKRRLEPGYYETCAVGAILRASGIPKHEVSFYARRLIRRSPELALLSDAFECTAHVLGDPRASAEYCIRNYLPERFEATI